MLTAATLLLALVPTLTAQDAPAAPDPGEDVLTALRAEADALRPLVATDAARAFLDATSDLPRPAARTLFASADRQHWYGAAQAAALPAEQRAGLQERALEAGFWWTTRYGSPLAYARALDLAGAQGLRLDGARVLDFGCGGLGAARLMAGAGAQALAVDVDPLLAAYYAEPGDQGEVPRAAGPPGRVRLLTGRWPADEALRAEVAATAPEGFDLILSKNTLKRGYIHPAEEVDPRKLVHLGVDDAGFVAEVAARLRPGGLFLVYNLCPAPAPPGQPYIPWADGSCPFERALLESAGLEVLAFDVVDDAPARALGAALGWDQGEQAMDLAADLFAWYSLARRPENRPK